jgi:hypothetical protein
VFNTAAVILAIYASIFLLFSQLFWPLVLLFSLRYKQHYHDLRVICATGGLAVSQQEIRERLGVLREISRKSSKDVDSFDATV